MTFSTRSLYPIFAILALSLFTGCATWNFNNYQPSPVTEQLDTEVPVNLSVDHDLKSSNKVRFNVKLSPNAERGFLEVTQQEFENRGFDLTADGLPIQLTLTDMVFGSANGLTGMPFVQIKVDGYNEAGSVVFTKEYRTYTAGRDREIEKPVRSIWSEEQAWSALQLLYQKMFTDAEFWNYLQGANANIDDAIVQRFSSGTVTPSASARQTGPTTTSLSRVDGGGMALSSNQRDLTSENIRNAWMKRGGTISSNGYGVGIMVYNLDTDIVTSTGTGFNVGGEVSQLMMKAPDYSNGTLSGFQAFKFGVNADIGYVNINTDVNAGGFSSSSTTSITQLTLGGDLGVMLGLGGGSSPLSWKGVVLGFSWKPSYQIIAPEEGDNIEQENLTGFSIDLDFAKMSTSMESFAPEPQNRISFFFLPAVKADYPTIFSISYKRVMY